MSKKKIKWYIRIADAIKRAKTGSRARTGIHFDLAGRNVLIQHGRLSDSEEIARQIDRI